MVEQGRWCLHSFWAPYFILIHRNSHVNLIVSNGSHTNGNGIYNTSHPLLERLTGQLEVEAPCPYNSSKFGLCVMEREWGVCTLFGASCFIY